MYRLCVSCLLGANQVVGMFDVSAVQVVGGSTAESRRCFMHRDL